MNVEEYRSVIHEDMALSASANMTNVIDEFILYVTGILSEADQFDDFVECYYEGVTRRSANMRIDGYSIDETDGSYCLFIADYHGVNGADSIYKEDIDASFKKIRYFVNEAITYELYQELEESTEYYELAKTLYYDNQDITKFRFYLLTDAYNKQRSKNIKDETIAGINVELNVWDINRLFELVNSKAQKESVEISIADYGFSGIPCVKAVEYNNVIADIDIMTIPADDEDGSEEDNRITYSSYLAVVPGKILNDIYLEYGSRLLEGNVRSFLSVRGKVNKGIQSTIKNYPEMFFAYNNGIAATATEIETRMTPNGLEITTLKDLQIVNGGQTTASIANTLLTLKKNENVDISRLYVPMKLSVLEHSMSERIIPKISEYSNSQNKVDASDFFSNHPFHIRMEGYSRKTPAPAVDGNQYQSYWYYERTRGQYNQGKMKFKPKSREIKEYETRYPDKQVIKMADLAKYMELFMCAPDKVSQGKQAYIKAFSEYIKDEWNKSDEMFNDYYYKRVVAIAILFRETDAIIKETQWYKEKRSYKANVVAYTLSVLFNFINEKARGYELDYMKIWNAQHIYKELELQITSLCGEVYGFITRDDRMTENVTQWCKRAECWKRAKAEHWTIHEAFISSLISKEEGKVAQKEAKETRKVANEVDSLKMIMSAGSDYWRKVLDWGIERKLLTDTQKDIIKLVINMETTGRIPTDKQMNVVVKARERLISEGMPYEFN